MPVFINGRFLTQPFTGVQKYAVGMSLNLRRLDPSIQVLVPHGISGDAGLEPKVTGRLKGILWEQVELPLFIRKHPGALLVSFCNSAPFLLQRQVVTIHDLAFEHDKRWFKGSFRRWYKFLVPGVARKSLAILTVSGFIRDEIRNRYGIPEKKIHIIPNGSMLGGNGAGPVVEGKYLLLSGVNNPRKNAGLVIRMLPEIVKRGYQLVTTEASSHPFRMIQTEAGTGLTRLGYVDDETYGNLVKHASAIVYPSYYEGFGVPVLEGILSGVPVIASDLPVFRESFGEIPLYFSGEAEFLHHLENLPAPGGSENTKQIHEKFNFATSAEKLMNILQDLSADL